MKEYYYLNSTPIHSYARMLYKYPQGAYPYADLVHESERRGKNDPEYELDDAPADVQHLARAADQFVVHCPTADDPDGKSIITGYPWFGDWGRDTMIALPGLTLTSGRPDVAEKILRTYARYVDRGMIPNRFPDSERHARVQHRRRHALVRRSDPRNRRRDRRHRAAPRPVSSAAKDR